MTEKLPIAILIPHGGLAVPPELNGRIALTPEQIFNEADAYADLIFDYRDRVLYWVTFPYARALVDVNRPNNPALTRPGDGVIKRQTSYGDLTYLPDQEPDRDLADWLLQRYWQPWHDQLAAIAADRRVKLVLDMHTMAAIGPTTYDDPGRKRPCVSVSNMGDETGNAVIGRYPICASPALTRSLTIKLGALFAQLPTFAPTGLPGGMNDPFWGGWNLIEHGGKHQPWLMIEVNRAMYIGLQAGRSPIVPPRETIIAHLRRCIWQAIESLVYEMLQMPGT